MQVLKEYKRLSKFDESTRSRCSSHHCFNPFTIFILSVPVEYSTLLIQSFGHESPPSKVSINHKLEGREALITCQKNTKEFTTRGVKLKVYSGYLGRSFRDFGSKTHPFRSRYALQCATLFISLSPVTRYMNNRSE